MGTDRLLPQVVRALERNRLGRASLRTYRRWANPRDPAKPRVLSPARSSREPIIGDSVSATTPEMSAAPGQRGRHHRDDAHPGDVA